MAANPYTAPQARVADIVEDAEYGTITMWSAKGRIGRLRYLAYTFGAWLVLAMCLGFVVGLLGLNSIGAFGLVLVAAYIAFFVFTILTSIQRSHDMGWSGWTVFLMLIPLVGFIWMFKPGTAGANNYGNPPPPNTTGVKILGLIAPLIVFIGVLAAIALPAYQQYVQRMQALEQQP